MAQAPGNGGFSLARIGAGGTALRPVFNLSNCCGPLITADSSTGRRPVPLMVSAHHPKLPTPNPSDSTQISPGLVASGVECR